MKWLTGRTRKPNREWKRVESNNLMWTLRTRISTTGYRGSKCLIMGVRKTRYGHRATFEGLCPFYRKDRWANAFMGRRKSQIYRKTHR